MYEGNILPKTLTHLLHLLPLALLRTWRRFPPFAPIRPLLRAVTCLAARTGLRIRHKLARTRRPLLVKPDLYPSAIIVVDGTIGALVHCDRVHPVRLAHPVRLRAERSCVWGMGEGVLVPVRTFTAEERVVFAVMYDFVCNTIWIAAQIHEPYTLNGCSELLHILRDPPQRCLIV